MSNLAFIGRTIDRLKNRYGVPIKIIQLGSLTVNYTTGKQERVETIIDITKAIAMQTNEARKLTRPRRLMDNVGMIDETNRVFIVSNTDLPGNFVLNQNDRLEYGGTRYDIKKIVDYDAEKQAVLIECIAVEGLPNSNVSEESISQEVSASQEITNE